MPTHPIVDKEEEEEEEDMCHMSEEETIVRPKKDNSPPKTAENPNWQDDVVEEIRKIDGVDLGFTKPPEEKWPNTFEHLWRYENDQVSALLIKYDESKDEYQLKICLPADKEGYVMSVAYGGPKARIAQMAEVVNTLASRVLKPKNANLDLGYSFLVNNPKYALTLFLNSYAKKHGLTKYTL